MTIRILTGVDGTVTALQAARKSARLGSGMEAEVVLLSAYPKYEVERIKAGSDQFVYSTEADSRQIAENVAAILRSEFPGLQVVAEAGEGKPGELLVERAQELDAHLVVVGNKRVQSPGRVLGSIATYVLHHAPCDVYIAHTHKRH